MHKLRDQIIRRLVGQQITKGELHVESALSPALLEGLPALLGINLERRLRVVIVDVATPRLARLLPIRGVIRFDFALKTRVQRTIPIRDAEIGGALKHSQVSRLLGDDRNGLNTGGTGTDDPDPSASEIHRLVRPVAGVVPAALEALQPLDRRHSRSRDATARHDAILG